MAALSAPLDSKKLDRRRVSCETLCSSNSSCVLQKRKPVHPLATGIKIKSSSSSIKQRVLSAKFLRFKTLQNELNDANFHIAQLINENKLLKNLQKRQDHALARYEGTSAELPKVLVSHQEELRSLQTRNKNLRKNIKELNDQIKIKDDEINVLKDQNKHLMSLCKNKNLEEREKLSKKLEELEDMLKNRDSTISTLNRKIVLETKNCKFKVNAEAGKNRHLQRELHKALAQVDHLTTLLEGKDKTVDTRVRRNVSNERKNALILKLNTYQAKDEKQSSLDRKKLHSNSSSSLINFSEDTESCSSSNPNIPENVIDPTATEYKKSRDSTPDFKKSRDSTPSEASTSSEIQLKKIVNNLQKKSTKQDSVQETLNEYCSDLIQTAQSCNKNVEKHTLDFENTTKETETLLSVLKENDDMSSKLNRLALSEDKMTVLDYTDFFKQSDKNLNQVAKAINLETNSSSSSCSSLEDSKSTIKTIRFNNNKPEVDNDDKERLLAKLRAIDNGETIEFTNMKKTKNDLLKELFG